MFGVPARLTAAAASDLHRRIGNHAEPFRLPFAWDAERLEGTAADGSRRKFHPSEVILGTGEVDGVSRGGAPLVTFTFADGAKVRTFKPFWFSL